TRKTPPNGGPWAAPTPTDGRTPFPAMWSPSPVIGGGRWLADGTGGTIPWRPSHGAVAMRRGVCRFRAIRLERDLAGIQSGQGLN
ncbi:MAG: hypothetical protein OXD45_02250, partial [Rhodobacteraceae bacterium]|nr:hypothetical protein [Paracoccaceae bacterium]